MPRGGYLVFEGKSIGFGTYSMVFKATMIDDSTVPPIAVNVAVKISKAVSHFFSCEREACYLRDIMKFPSQDKLFITPMLRSFCYGMQRHVMVMPLMACSLHQAMRMTSVFKLNQALFTTLQVLRALDCALLPPNSLIHRDIKPTNILVAEDGLKMQVADWGKACKLGDFKKRNITNIQARWHRAPEVVLGMRHGPAMDVWSVGVILVEMLIHMDLLVNETDAEYVKKLVALMGPPPSNLLQGEYAQSLFVQEQREESAVNDSASLTPLLHELILSKRKSFQSRDDTGDFDLTFDLITRMLTWDPNKRITAKDAMRHRAFDCIRENVADLVSTA